MKKLKRLIWCALLFGIQTLYFPLNRFLEGGLELKTPLDQYIPLWTIWVVPYSLICVWWVAAYLWAAWQMDDGLYESLFIATAVMCVSGLIVFTVYPTYVLRPTLTVSDWSSEWLNFIYTNDYAYNAFPSGHVYITTLIALFWSRWYPRGRWLWMGTVVVIIFATLFTHQHYLLDPIGGLALAWFSYHIGLWCVSDQSSVKKNPVMRRSEV